MNRTESQLNRDKRFRHVVWDWNGTLLNDTRACVEALNAILAWQQRPSVTETEYRQTFGFPVQDYYRGLGLPCEGALWDELTRIFHDHYAVASRRAPLREGIRDILGALRERNTPMSVLSACEASILERMIRERDILDCFEHIYGLDNLDAHSKFDIGHALMKTLAIPPSNILLIGDTTHDYDVASALGCACLLLADGHQSAERLKACGCAIAQTPEAILEFMDASD